MTGWLLKVSSGCCCKAAQLLGAALGAVVPSAETSEIPSGDKA